MKRLFSSKSIFTRILSILFIFSVITVCIFYYVGYHNIYVEATNQMSIDSHNLLEKANKVTEASFKDLENQMYQLAMNEYIQSEMLAPNIDNSTRNYNIITQLQFVSQSNSLITNVYLYIPTDETIYSSSGFVMTEEDYLNENSFNRVLFDSVIPNLPLYPGTIDALYMNSRMFYYLVAPTFYTKALGLILFEINSSVLNQLINGEENEGSQELVWLYDGKERILSSYIEYPEDYTVENDKTNSKYYSITSDTSGWTYVTQSTNTAFESYSNEQLKNLMIFMILLIIALIVISYLITRIMYQPINNLLKNINSAMSREAGNAAKRTNEIKYIEERFQEVISGQHELQDYIDSLRPSLTEELFRNILSGKLTDPAEIRSSMMQLGLSFSADDKYTTALIGVTEDSTEKAGKNDSHWIAQHLLYKTIESSISEQKKNFSVAFINILDKNQMLIVMGFKKTEEDKKIWETINTCTADLCSSTREFPMHIIIGQSWTLVPVTELDRSFQISLQEYRYLEYVSEKNNSREFSMVPTFDERQIIQDIFSIMLGEVRDGDYIKACDHFLSSIQQLINIKNTTDDLVEFLKIISETAVETQVASGNTELINIINQNMENALEEISSSKPNSGRIILLEYCRQLISLINNSTSVDKKLYTDRAIEIIQNNYSNSDLSLDFVANSLGISASYLSSQFKKTSGKSFVDYLNSYRIEKAKSMLKMTSMTIENIGFQTGFSSTRNFIRVFKRYENVSPGKYRESI